MPYTRRLMFATAVLSFALIGYQIVMLQIISISQWYHFANMVVSIALLGFGAAGTTLSLWREPLLKRAEWMLPLLAALSGLSMVAAVELSQYNIARFDSYLLFVNPSQWVSLLITYVLYLLPFYFGALVLGIIFTKFADEIGRYYFINLIGSGIGGVIAAFLAWFLMPSVLPSLFGMATCIAGLLVLPHEKRSFIISIAAAVLLYDSYRVINPIKLSTSEYKSLDRTMNMPDARIVLEKPSPFGLIQIVSAEGLRYAPGVSLTFQGEIPVKSVAFNNGEWVGPLISGRDYDAAPFLDFTTMGLPYVLSGREKVLILHSGTGLPVAQALNHRLKLIHAVEPNEALVDLLCHELARENDSIFYHPYVKLFAIEPRAFISDTKEKYDLIYLPIIGSFGGTMGMYSMREEYTLTIESFLNLFDLLGDGGVICVTAWMDYPFRNPLKLTATLSKVLEISGKNKTTHLAAARSWGTVTFLLSKSPFQTEDVTRLRSFCDSLLFDPLLMPGIAARERMNYNVMHDTTFFSYIDQLVSGENESLSDSYDFYLAPATDEKPYFSQFLRWKSLPHLREVFGMQSVPFLEMGFLVSVITFIQITFLSVVLIIVPLTRMKWKGKPMTWTLLYFGGLGIGYMLFEIALIQRFMFVFANAVYAVAFVVGVILIASGLGSYFSSTFTRLPRAWLVVLFVIALMLLLHALFFSEVLQWIARFSGSVKWIASFIIVAIPSFLMGMPFPRGIQLCSSTDESTVPWAWGINGSASVISAAIAALLAVEFGFTWVVIISSMAYLVAFLSSYLMLRLK